MSLIDHSGYVLKSPDYGNPLRDGTDERIAMIRSGSGVDGESHTITGFVLP
jgi:hypothetical protein